MKTKQPTRKDLEAKIARQYNALNDAAKRLDTQSETIRNKNIQIERLNDAEDEKDCQLAKRVHGLTALTFAVLAFAVGIVVGGNIKSRSQENTYYKDMVIIDDSTNTAYSVWLDRHIVATNFPFECVITSDKTYSLSMGNIYDKNWYVLTIKPLELVLTNNNTGEWHTIIFYDEKTYLSPYVKKGAELLRP